uniref:C-type LECtin n=1 Tax=Caenorhabditis tropicalis TaxID=1561998 RepID=A0A1I7UGH9_9PELO
MKLLLFLSLIGIVHTQLVCPPGYTLVVEKCLKIIQNPLTHTQAEQDCTYSGGTLVNIHTAIENRAVAQFVAAAGLDKTWIGLYCFANKDTSNCYHDDNFGTAANYDSFASGYPLIDGIYGRCVYMATTGPLAGKWISVKCEAENISFVCEVPSSTYDPTCVHNYDGNCYFPSYEMNTTLTNFADAQSICQGYGGNLASIHSKRENDYVMSLVRGNSNLRYLMIGGQETLPNTFSWTDGSNFAGFDYRDPVDPSTMTCLTFIPSTGLWNRYDCTANVYFLCKRPIPGAVLTPQPPVLTQNPSDFSNCNTTMVMSPGVITSYGYLDTTPNTVYCTWNVVSLGAYRVRLTFTDVSTYNRIYTYDEYGNYITSISSIYSGVAIAPTSIMNVTFQASGMAGYHGFRAVALPY